MTPYSILNLAPIVEGGTPADALNNALDLAQHAERLGYTRYWLAEHHNMTGIASAATSVVIGHVAGGTKTIRVGSGGIMLPNHAPLVIAEIGSARLKFTPSLISIGSTVMAIDFAKNRIRKNIYSDTLGKTSNSNGIEKKGKRTKFSF